MKCTWNWCGMHLRGRGYQLYPVANMCYCAIKWGRVIGMVCLRGYKRFPFRFIHQRCRDLWLPVREGTFLIMFSFFYKRLILAHSGIPSGEITHLDCAIITALTHLSLFTHLSLLFSLSPSLPDNLFTQFHKCSSKLQSMPSVSSLTRYKTHMDSNMCKWMQSWNNVAILKTDVDS